MVICTDIRFFIHLFSYFIPLLLHLEKHIPRFFSSFMKFIYASMKECKVSLHFFFMFCSLPMLWEIHNWRMFFVDGSKHRISFFFFWCLIVFFPSFSFHGCLFIRLFVLYRILFFYRIYKSFLCVCVSRSCVRACSYVRISACTCVCVGGTAGAMWHNG